MKITWLLLFLCVTAKSWATSGKDDFGNIGNLQGVGIRARQTHETAGRHVAYSLKLTWETGAAKRPRSQEFLKGNYDWIDWKTSFRVHPAYLEILVKGNQVDDSNPGDPDEKPFARRVCVKPRDDFSRFDEFDCPRLPRQQAR